jgi:hypothetical protein
LLVVHAISLLSAPGKPSPPRSPLFSATPSVPSHLTPPLSPWTGPGASPDLRAAPRPEGPASSPPLSSGAIDRAGELRISVVRPHRCDLVCWTMSGRCAEGHGCTLWTPSHGSSNRRPPQPAPRGVPSLHAARHVDLDVVHPRPALRTTSCLAAPCSIVLHPCTNMPSVSRR